MSLDKIEDQKQKKFWANGYESWNTDELDQFKGVKKQESLSQVYTKVIKVQNRNYSSIFIVSYMFYCSLTKESFYS